jgi:hypothetical protein
MSVRWPAKPMTKIVTTREIEAPVAAPITSAHRSEAFARGVSIDATVAALRHSLAEGAHALGAIVASAPAEDSNLPALRSLHQRLHLFAGEIALFAPEPTRVHTIFDGRR